MTIKPVYINRFDGGRAQSERPNTINEQLDGYGFDIFTDNYKLKRAPMCTTNLTTGSNYDLFINDAAERLSDGLVVGVGQVSSASTVGKFYSNNSNILGNWTQNTQNFAAINTQGNSFINLYKDNFYATIETSSNVSVYKYTNDSTIVSIGNVADRNAIVPKPVVHSQDNILYVAGGKTIGKYDGTTWTGSAITLPYTITSMCEYGTYLAIACQAPFGGVIYLWGRDTSLTTLQDVIFVDAGALMIIENLGGILTAITESNFEVSTTASPSLSFDNKVLSVRQYTGATMQEIKSTTYSFTNENGGNQTLKNKKLIKNNTLYFSTNTNHLWRFGKTKSGQYSLVKEIKIALASNNLIDFYGMFQLGDYFVTCLRFVSNIVASVSNGISRAYFNNIDLTTARATSDTAYYYTTINPSMPESDKNRDKQLKYVCIRGWSNSTSEGNISVEVSVDNGVTYTTLVNQSATYTTKLLKFTALEDTSNNPLSSGVEFIFRLSTQYYVDILDFEYGYEVVDPILEM